MARPARIFVVCPGGVATGGPELLHQLVHELGELGQNAAISYYPFDSIFETPDRYRHYNISSATPSNAVGDVLVLPESATKLVGSFPRMNVVVWWLSVYNYYHLPPQTGWRAWVPAPIAAYFARLPIRKLSRYAHLCQSEYARTHLLERGIAAQMLSDYISLPTVPPAMSSRENLVAYNPKKGVNITRRLVDSLPHVRFVPIENMSAQEVAKLLSCAKIYIDFGHHPGKDRMPREAAAAGACVVTGRQGSAANALDVPIPERFKIDEKSLDFVELVESRIEEIFVNFEIVTTEFEHYRAHIRDERDVFRRQCAEIFGG